MKSTWRMLLVALAMAVGAVGTACGDDDAGSGDTTGILPVIAPSAPSAVPLESFRYTSRVGVERAGEMTSELTISGSFAAPDSHQYSLNSDIADADGTEVVVIGGQAWVKDPGGVWEPSTRTGLLAAQEELTYTSLNEEFLDSYPTFLARIREKKGNGDTIEGASVTRYELDDEDDTEFQRIFGQGQAQLIAGEESKVTVWIDNATGHLRRAVLDVGGAAENPDEQLRLVVEINTTDVNDASIAISPPK